MKRISRAALTVLGLTLVPGFCTAGPIRWSYSSTVETRVMADGNGFGYVFVGHSFDGDSMRPWPVYGSISAAPGQSGLTGSATVPVGFVTFSGEPSPADNGDNWYTYRLTLTDAASGESGLLSVSGTLRASERNNPGGRIFNDFTSPTSASLLLGDHLYRTVFTFRTTPAHQFPGGLVDAIVTVSEIQPTPEPSTLVLGSVGLACLSLFARRARFWGPSGAAHC